MKGMIALAIAFGVGTGVVGLATSPPAQASPWSKHVNQRQKAQQKRLVNGVKNDSLTKRELVGLEKRQAKLAAKERRMRRTGRGLTPREAKQLNQDQNRLSRNIYKQKHDDQSRSGDSQ